MYFPRVAYTLAGPENANVNAFATGSIIKAYRLSGTGYLAIPRTPLLHQPRSHHRGFLQVLAGPLLPLIDSLPVLDEGLR